jgi:glycine cleavage system transcriptional repressor
MAAQLIAVTAIGNDRPGIVAGVTRVLYELGCNLEDATSTILRGHFAMMLVVRAPGELAPAALEARFEPLARALGLVITARAVDEAELAVGAPTHAVSVYGADRPGIVYRVAELLAACGANITDFTSRVIGGAERPVYALLLEVAFPPEAAPEAALGALRAELGVEISVHPIEADVL